MRGDQLDLQFGEQAGELALGQQAEQLLLEAGFAGILEDRVAISVDGERDAVALADLAHEQEIARRILLFPEQGAHHLARGVIDRPRQGQPRAASFQPSMVGGVELQQHAGPEPPLPALMAVPPPILVRAARQMPSASVSTCSRAASGNRCGEGRPRLRCTNPAAPSAR